MLKFSAGTMLGAAGLALCTTAAHAARVKSVSLDLSASPTKIEVIAENGVHFSKIRLRKPIDVKGKLVAKMKTGRISKVGIGFADCRNAPCSEPNVPVVYNSLVWNVKNLTRHPQFQITGAMIRQSKGEAQRIFAACNAIMGKSLIQTRKTITHTLNFTVGLEFKKHGFQVNGGVPDDHRSRHQTKVYVHCVAPKPGPDQVGFDHGDFKIKTIKLTRTTYQGVNHSVSPGASCPILVVKTRIETNQKGNVSFDYWQQLGDKPMTKKSLNIQAKHQPNGTYIAEYRREYRFTKNTYAQFRAQETVNPIGLATPWKDIHIKCDSGASGDLAGTANPGVPPQDLPNVSYSGAINITSPHGNRYQCPRTGAVTAIIRSNREDDVRYKLDCTNGKSWQGKITMKPDGAGGYIGHAGKTFKVKKTGKLVCALKRVNGNKIRALTMQGKDFTCAKVTSGVAMDGLTAGKAQKTKKALLCEGGRMRKQKCYCPKQTVKKKIFKQAKKGWRCEKSTAGKENRRMRKKKAGRG